MLDLLDMQKVSIIIATKDRLKDTIICVKSILKQTILPKEIIIVDSSDTDMLGGKLAKFKKIRYYNKKANLTKARNIGIDKSKGDIVMFLDDDVILDRNYIKEILKIFKLYSDIIGGVSGNIKQNQPCGKFSIFFRTLFFLDKTGSGKFRLSGWPTFLPKSINKITTTESLYGANMSFKKEVISKFKFDSNRHACDDMDIAYRISRKYQNFYTPFARLIHNNSPTFGGNNYRVWKMETEAFHYYFKKNLPQDFRHKLASYMSIIGLFILTLKTRNLDNIKGFLAGVKLILKNNHAFLSAWAI